jgi:2'-5' RNA ligase
MPRLFCGIEIPLKARLALASLKAPLSGAKWVEADEMHVTLRFAGDIDNRAAEEFADALAAIDLDVFEVRICGLGAFGGNDPRAVWAGVEGSEPLAELARACERSARKAGLPPETRTFKPHVTLARLRGTPVEAVARFLEHNGGFRLEPFVVERFVLYSSRPLVGGGPYVVEEAFPLRGSSPGAADESETW